MAYGWGWRPYVPVARRRATAAKQMDRLRKKGADIQPVLIEGRTIARTFWGASWCKHLEQFSDFENRLPRGRTYVRNGSVCHLAIERGRVVAKVCGSELYDVELTISALSGERWRALRERCAGRVGSLLELLAGRLSDQVMAVVTDPQSGLFPRVGEMRLSCSCPDWATMCKHVAAVLYGVGARLDHRPELLFTLRGVDQAELVGSAEARTVIGKARKSTRTLAESSLGDVFGIELAATPAVPAVPMRKPGRDKAVAKAAKKTVTRAKATPRKEPLADGRKSGKQAKAPVSSPARPVTQPRGRRKALPAPAALPPPVKALELKPRKKAR